MKSDWILNTLKRCTVVGVYLMSTWDVTEVDVKQSPTVTSRRAPVCMEAWLKRVSGAVRWLVHKANQ